MNVKHNQDNTMDSLDQGHHVLVIEDPSFHREIHLDAATYSIGRHSSNDIVLSCQKTSRNHATLLRRTDVKTNKYSYWVLDGDLQGNRSRNGIFINGKKTLVHELKPGDVIQFSADAQATYKLTQELAQNTILNSQLDSIPFSSEKSSLINKETIVNPPPAAVNQTKAVIPDSSRQISLTELSPQPIIEIDLYGNITYINSAGIIHFKDIHHQKLTHPLLDNLITIYNQGRDNIIHREVKIGEKTFLQTAHYLPENKIIRNYVVDITQQKYLEARLQYQNNLYDQVSQNIAEGIIVIESATKKIIEVNSAISNLLGYDTEKMLQMNVYELCSSSQNFSAILQKVIVEKNSYWGEYLFRHRDGEMIKTQIKIDLIASETKETVCLLISSLSKSNDVIQESQKIAQENTLIKETFKQQVVTAIASAERGQNLVAIMICKLYFLPDIRENLGETKSQELLATLGKRLNSCIRLGDTVVHWHDDKFALLMPQINNIDEVAKINQRIKKSVEQSFKLGEVNVTLNGTIGIAVYPQDGVDTDVLWANANSALERAFNQKNSYQFYNESMNSQAVMALELENLLQNAVEKSEFKLYYQPQINLDTGKIEAIKALLRWQHPELGLVPPNSFIKSAETTGLIIPIGEWILRQACQQNKTWQQEGFPASKIIINLSTVQFKQNNLVQKIADILAETTLEPQLLELEISASSLQQDIDYSKTMLKKLKELGISLAVDQFVAGFSALEYLKYFPLDTLKIDRSLVQQMIDSNQDLAIVTALIELGRGFDLRVVAEGVETQEQVDLLRSLNCQYMQGFWFGRPLEATEASKLFTLNDSHVERVEQKAKKSTDFDELSVNDR